MSGSSIKSNTTRQTFLICLGLILMTVSVYWRVRGFEFVNYDDAIYILNNSHVLSGLTGGNVLWAFKSGYASNWHPLTWLSHMLDYQFYGLKAGGHHFTNVLFHTANTLLLFGLLRRMTGKEWRSAVVAALFALHPMHVESVAWVAERKDVLSVFFGLLALWVYARYAEQSKVQSPRSKVSYGWSLFFFLLGLLSKPMLVTLPLLMLLLDYWPLQRNSKFKIQNSKLETGERSVSMGWLIVEKIPFFVLTIASSIVTFIAQRADGAVVSGGLLPVGERAAGAVVAYVRYLAKLLWPGDLVVFYPYLKQLEWWQVAGAGLLLAGITAAALGAAGRRPYLIVGWLWFLISLVPVIGLVQVGGQSMADRYSYLPSIGLFMGLVWGAADITTDWGHRSFILGGATAALLATLGWMSWIQVQYWHDSFSLWTHCLAAGSESVVVHRNYGIALDGAGKTREAIEQYEAALRLDPSTHVVDLYYGEALLKTGREREATNYFASALADNPASDQAHKDMGLALLVLGNVDGAVAELAEAVRLNASNAAAHTGLGSALSAQGKSDEALKCFNDALEIDPKFAAAYCSRGQEYLNRGSIPEAVSSLEQAVQADPKYVAAHILLGQVYSIQHEPGKAILEYRTALSLRPDLPEVMNNLAWLLATTTDARSRDGGEAVKLAEGACEQTSWQKTFMIGTLAAAYAEAGDFDKAVQTAQKACDLASARGEKELLQRNQELLAQYKNHQPYHEKN